MHVEGQDASFLLGSLFSQDSGVKPRAVYRNLSAAELYEKVWVRTLVPLTGILQASCMHVSLWCRGWAREAAGLRGN